MKTLLLIVSFALTGCESMTPETQAILASGAMDAINTYAGKRRTGKEPVPADGPDTVGIQWPRQWHGGKEPVPADGPDTTRKTGPDGPNFGPP